MTAGDLHGFPPGYFLIRALNSDYYGKRMLLDVARSERRPGVELVLWVDEAPVWHMKHQHEDSQIFFMSEDGLLRSKTSGHAIGWQTDKATNTPKLLVQPPRPFNYRPQPHCHFTYDLQSKTITTKLPYEVQAPSQSFEIKRRDTDVSQTSSIAISVTSVDESTFPCSPGTERNYLLEVIPRGHRQSRIVQFFDSVLESPSEEPEQPPPSPGGRTHRQEDVRNDSWYKGRELRLARERTGKRKHINKLQQWEIIPLSCASCDATSEAWAI